MSAEPADLARDDIIWFGGLFPLSTEPDMDSEMHAAELARQEFAQALGSSGERRGEMRARPIGLVVCDEGSDAARAARHLAEDVEVPAVIGFRSAKSALATIPPILLPNRVLSFLTITEAADVTSIPEPKGEPRLIWRSTLSATAQRAPTSALISEVLEPLARSRPGGLGDRPMRVAVVRRAAPHVVADADFRALRFNGKSALDNGDNFQQFVAGPIDAGSDEVVDALLDFGPEVVYPRVDDGFVSRVIVPLEKRWRHGPRPFFILGPVFEPALLDFIGKDSERRRRFFGLTNVSSAVNSELVLRYNVAFPREPVTPTTAPQPSYDAFYVLAYAAIALGDSSVNGPDLSRAMSRLLPPGHPVDVGPAGIFDAFETLRSEEGSISRGPSVRSISTPPPEKNRSTTRSSAAGWTLTAAPRARSNQGSSTTPAAGCSPARRIARSFAARGFSSSSQMSAHRRAMVAGPSALWRDFCTGGGERGQPRRRSITARSTNPRYRRRHRNRSTRQAPW